MSALFNFIDKINYNLGLRIFKNSNLLSYNLYNHYYKKNICNLDYLKHEFINTYYKNGYAKLGRVNNEKLKELNKHLEAQKPSNNNDFLFHYKITPEMLKILKSILQSDLDEQIKLIESYYNQKLVLTFLTISRNYPSSKNNETYSNFFHTDGYAYNMFKIFINLHDVGIENGPLTLVKKEYSKDFLKKLNYKNRNSYNKDKLNINDEIFFNNVGKKGEALLCSTTELIHRAGDPTPGNYRDMIFFNFVAHPTKENISLFEYEDKIFDDGLIKKLSKIKGLKNLIKYYRENLRKKTL